MHFIVDNSENKRKNPKRKAVIIPQFKNDL